MECAATGKDQHTSRQIVNIAYMLLFNTGVYHDDWKTGRQKPIAEKTWEEFKTFFTKANQDLRVSLQTARTAGFQSNNTMSEGQDSEIEAQVLRV